MLSSAYIIKKTIIIFEINKYFFNVAQLKIVSKSNDINYLIYIC